jgi:glycosyltransferase involved in cell wall biosynthesis
MWLEGRGPVVPELVGQLRRRVEDFEALVFFTYSSWTTIRGLEAAQGRTLLVPAEPWGPHLQLPLVSRAFRQAAAVAFDTEEERVQAERVLGEPLAAAEVVGRGIPAVPAAPAATDLRSGAAPYVLLAGRLEAEDGCAATIERFMRRQRDGRSSLTLVLVGRGRVELHETPSVRHLGELPEAETRAMMAGARAVLVPSRREALAPLALEAWRESRPVLATGGSEVMRGVVERAGGGIACRGYDELAAALDLLEEEPALFDALGRQGRLYLETEHALPRVLDRYERILARLADRAAAA